MHSGDLMHRAWIAIPVGVACLLIGGCTSEAADPSGTPTAPASSTPSGASPSPSPTATSEPSPSAPVMPALARKKTPAGAKAFVRYYVEVLNNAYSTHQLRPLKRASGRACSVCALFIRNIETLARRGGKQVGGELIPYDLQVIPSGDRARAIVVASVEINQGAYRLSDKMKFRTIRPRRAIYEVHLLWGQRWYVTEMRSA